MRALLKSVLSVKFPLDKDSTKIDIFLYEICKKIQVGIKFF
mgnify:CR=1 FL=1